MMGSRFWMKTEAALIGELTSESYWSQIEKKQTDVVECTVAQKICQGEGQNYLYNVLMTGLSVPLIQKL
jgi:hypothetical protein